MSAKAPTVRMKGRTKRAHRLDNLKRVVKRATVRELRQPSSSSAAVKRYFVYVCAFKDGRLSRGMFATIGPADGMPSRETAVEATKTGSTPDDVAFLLIMETTSDVYEHAVAHRDMDAPFWPVPLKYE